MAYREYIGSRYVPIFGRKDEDTIAWDNSKDYEPLTIVTYQGNSYTSRQAVPAGIDISNGEYWALTGNYNAQIENYRREVQQYNGRITENEQAIDVLETSVAEIESNGWVTGERIANAAVNTDAIADGAVTNTKIADGAVGTDAIADDAVTDAKIADGAVGTDAIANDAVTDAKIADGAVGTDALADDAVTGAKIADGAISWDNLDDDMKKWNTATDLLVESEAFLNATTGNDKTAKLNDKSLPFQTLDAAFKAMDKLGNNFRFVFTDSATTVDESDNQNHGFAEYVWNMRVITGSVVHFFSDRRGNSPTATVPIRITIDNHTPGGESGVFFYDTHLACYSNNTGPMTIRCRHKYNDTYYRDFIECEGSTFWSGGYSTTTDTSDSGHLTLDIVRLYLIQGSAQLAGMRILGRLEGLFADTRFAGCRVDGTTNTSTSEHCAIQFTGGTHRINDTSSNESFVSDSILFGNQTSNNLPAMRWYNAFVNFPVKEKVKYYAGSGKSNWHQALALYSCVAFITDTTSSYIDSLAQNAMSETGLQVRANTHIPA